MQFDVAKVTDAGLVPASGNIMTPPGAPVYVIGNAEASHGDSIIRTTAFANWSDGDTKYITQLSSDGLSRVFRHSDAYAPLELLPNNELMMLDASECLLKSPAETTDAESRSEQICSSNIVAVALPGNGGAIDTAAKRTIRRFAAPDLLLATTNPASLSDKSSISLIGDLVFTVSRNAKGPHLDWVSITDPARGGRLDLEASAGDNISILHRDDFSGHLQLAVDGFLSPLKFVSIAIGKGGNSDPYVGDIVKVRPPTFAAEKFSVSPIGSEAGGVSALLVSQAPSPHGRTCRGRALIEVYGGYGVTTHLDYLTSYGPYWLERGNSYIAAFVRGGGDMGEQGYRQGINGHFTASVDDLIAIAKEARKRGCSDVTVKGASHGGNLAALAALKAPDSIDRAIIDESPLDLARGLTAGSFDASIYPTFQDEAAKTAFMRQASPLSVVEQFKSKRQPSFLLLYGGRDEIAPSYHGEAFAKAARQKGIEVELIIDPNLAHGPPTSVDGYAEQMSHILSFANRGR
ncbi:hypothetical protein ATE71_07535 [Sphingopyxis sp. H115]|nr:hypothetical protein ATE71_07535 [Sphingopyxis sp. H115]